MLRAVGWACGPRLLVLQGGVLPHASFLVIPAKAGIHLLCYLLYFCILLRFLCYLLLFLSVLIRCIRVIRVLSLLFSSLLTSGFFLSHNSFFTASWYTS